MTKEERSSNITTTKVYAHTHFVMVNHEECHYLGKPQALVGVMDENVKHRASLESFKAHWMKQQTRR
jgi:hypothetical protein